MKRNILYTIAIITISIFLTSWGHTGHKKISYNCIFSFNPDMSQFLIWATQLQEHASDADDRKSGACTVDDVWDWRAGSVVCGGGERGRGC